MPKINANGQPSYATGGAEGLVTNAVGEQFDLGQSDPYWDAEKGEPIDPADVENAETDDDSDETEEPAGDDSDDTSDDTDEPKRDGADSFDPARKSGEPAVPVRDGVSGAGKKATPRAASKAPTGTASDKK